MPSRIEDYALIGDLETSALVGKDGSIDWLCWPRFDSDACMCALLGGPEHGRFLIAPTAGGARVTRRYRQDTLILETRFETDEGAVTLIDFMPPREKHSSIVRIVRGERGTVTMQAEMALRFGYGQIVPWVSRQPDGTRRAIAGPDMVILRTEADLRGHDQLTSGDFTVTEGQTVYFCLTYVPSHLTMQEDEHPEEALDRTETFWTEWAGQAKATGPYREAVMRSLITLKGLTYSPTGGIVAAPTTSLPETLGGRRNWDYRFCWLRDATLSLLALMNEGLYEEATAWRDWLLRAVAGTPSQIQIMYGIAGERRLTEWTVDALPGYEGSQPVRIGNAAHDQLQIDVFGEVLDALYQAHRGGVPQSPEGSAIIVSMLGHLAEIWMQPDKGIWESRDAPMHYVYSKVMAWLAFDRGVKLVEERSVDAPVAEWRALADTIHAEVCEKGFDPELNSFVMAYGSKLLDGSLLLIATTGFLPPDDPRIQGTLAAMEGRMLQDGFVMRHDPSQHEEGLEQHEGAFLACSFWLVDAYALAGRHADALKLLKSAAGAAQRCRAAGRRVRREGQPAGRQLPAGLLAHRADQLGPQPEPAGQAGGAAQRGWRDDVRRSPARAYPGALPTASAGIPSASPVARIAAQVSSCSGTPSRTRAARVRASASPGTSTSPPCCTGRADLTYSANSRAVCAKPAAPKWAGSR